MRDLDFWRRLDGGDITPAELCACAASPLSRRAVYFGRVLRLVEHADPAIRAAALTVLAAVRGVAGIRAIVERLDDDDENVRRAAVDALRATAREAGGRYAYALFHERLDVRRAALADVPHASTEMIAYLRADPACADLLTKWSTWPKERLPLAFDLYAMGALSATELVASAFASTNELRTFLEREPGRTDSVIDAYLARRTELVAAPGRDPLDLLVRAIVEATAFDNPLDELVKLATAKPRTLIGRVRVAVQSALATAPIGPLWAVAVALTPELLMAPAFDRAHAMTVADGLSRFGWPIRPYDEILAAPPAERDDDVRVLVMPAWIRDDLALAAAVIGWLPAKRLRGLANALTESAILDALVASDHGWEQICKMPPEEPALELRWLGAIERTRPQRHAQLAAITLRMFSAKRLEAFIDQMLRTSRAPALIELARSRALDADHPHAVAIVALLAARIDASGAATLLDGLLVESAPRMRFALLVARSVPAKLLRAAGREIDDATARHIVHAIDDDTDALPRDREVALANAFRERSDPELVAWAERVLRVETAAPVVPLPAIRPRRALTAAERTEITSATPAHLDEAVKIAMLAPTTGLVEALATRPPVASVAVSAALLISADPLEEVARELDRFSSPAPTFDVELDTAAIALWRTAIDLPPLAHARLWRWEAHIQAFVRWIDAAGGPLPALRAVAPLPGRMAISMLWCAIAEAITFVRYRDRPHYLRLGTPELARFAAERIDRWYGRSAARICVGLVEGGAVMPSMIRDILLDRVVDATADTRDELVRIIRLDGMPEPPPSEHRAPPERGLIETIQRLDDLDALVVHCRDRRRWVVQEAVATLLAHGEHGQLRLAKLIGELPTLASPLPLIQSISLWDVPEAITSLRTLAAAGALPPEWQFHVCIALEEREGAIAAVREPSETSWMRRKDWSALIALGGELEIALHVVDAMHHHAYAPAVAVLLERAGADPQLVLGETPRPRTVIEDALRRFLEVSSARPLDLRRRVAQHLVLACNDPAPLPILIDELVDTGPTPWLPRLPRELALDVAGAIVDAALVGGHGACTEKRMWELLAALADGAHHRPLVLHDELAELYARILVESMTPTSRQSAAIHVVSKAASQERMYGIAQVFAWGVRRGFELTGRMFRFHVTAKETDLGHTFLDGNKIYVTALPMLRDEPNGTEIVEGLVLHEIGHHIYHRSEPALRLWKRAHAEGLGHLLNLIADEHLERNLRSHAPEYGDRLKRLDAYAFQHAEHEMKIVPLLASLRGAAAGALIPTAFGIAFDEASLRLRRGAVLAELERNGHPLARFARALRMGLGNRHGDPLVGQALDLCNRSLKRLDMQGLYDLTCEIAALFGGACAVANVFGGPENLEFGERDNDVFGAGIDDEILQREVERILEPKSSGGPRAKGPRRLQINVNPSEAFDPIETVRKVPGIPEEHRKLATEVNRHAIRLRACLDDLGLRWQPARGRIQGRAVDRTRLRGLVTRGDPRVLIARTPVRRTDLFLGTLIDCSGSMQAGDNIDRARRFAVLIAEAVRPLPGVETRFFGFNDTEIFDAGTAADCGVTSLVADHGNNDAAALFHAANVALQSTRSARVLVMISDGLPTQCSVPALRGLVTTLTRRKNIVCAQVAVRPLEEECFPHYVVLDDDRLDVSVAKFGAMIAKLARRALGA